MRSTTTIYSHTGLRGISALYVAIFHLLSGETNYTPKTTFDYFFSFGAYGVDLFFILSGFILNWVYLSDDVPPNWPSYFKARVARIMPLYYLTMALLLPIPIYRMLKFGPVYDGSYLPTVLVLNLFMVSGIVDGFKSTLNSPAWSISVEFFCYLAIFPVLVFFRKRIVEARANLLMFLMMGACMFFVVSCYTDAPVLIRHWDCSFLGRGISGFSIGFFLCCMYQKTLQWKPSAGTVNRVMMTAIAIFLLVVFKFIPSYIILCMLPFIVFFSASDQGFVADLLKTEPFQWLGERSYSIYLWHMLLFGRYTLPLYNHLSHLTYNIIIVALLFAVAEVSYLCFERPARDYIRKFSPRLVRPNEAGNCN